MIILSLFHFWRLRILINFCLLLLFWRWMLNHHWATSSFSLRLNLLLIIHHMNLLGRSIIFFIDRTLIEWRLNWAFLVIISFFWWRNILRLLKSVLNSHWLSTSWSAFSFSLSWSFSLSFRHSFLNSVSLIKNIRLRRSEKVRFSIFEPLNHLFHLLTNFFSLSKSFLKRFLFLDLPSWRRFLKINFFRLTPPARINRRVQTLSSLFRTLFLNWKLSSGRAKLQRSSLLFLVLIRRNSCRSGKRSDLSWLNAWRPQLLLLLLFELRLVNCFLERGVFAWDRFWLDLDYFCFLRSYLSLLSDASFVDRALRQVAGWQLTHTSSLRRHVFCKVRKFESYRLALPCR